MDTKEMKSCKHKLITILSTLYSDLEKEVKFDWCTSHSIFGLYDNIYSSIKSYKNFDFVPTRNTKLACDYVSRKSHLVIEYDEIQHFTYQRQLSLEAYPDDIKLYYNKETWIRLCKELHRKMNKKTDPYRDEKRALYDSIRDVMFPRFCYRLVRLYHGLINFDSKNAKDELLEIIDGQIK